MTAVEGSVRTGRSIILLLYIVAMHATHVLICTCTMYMYIHVTVVKGLGSAPTGRSIILLLYIVAMPHMC